MDTPEEKFDIELIAEKFARGTISAEERAYFEKWYASFNDEELKLYHSRFSEVEQLKKKIFDKIEADRKSRRGIISPLKRRMTKYLVAASLLMVFGVGGYFLIHTPGAEKAPLPFTVNKIMPGSNKAILTLANGRKLSLEDTKTGKLVKDGNAEIFKTLTGEITYKNTSEGSAEDTFGYNTVTTPAGGQYTVVLPDGSKAFLNAMTSIRFPTKFVGDQRQVQLSGESYFEVVHNPKKPFRVISNGQTITVLGTMFNVHAYPDEPVIRTTLIKGSVKITRANEEVKLRPGQASRVNTVDQLTRIAILPDVDTGAALAWKNGQFEFDNEPLDYIMLQFSRWYNVDVSYLSDFKDQRYSGSVSRYANIDDALKILESTGTIHFKLQGRRLLIKE